MLSFLRPTSRKIALFIGLLAFNLALLASGVACLFACGSTGTGFALLGLFTGIILIPVKIIEFIIPGDTGFVLGSAVFAYLLAALITWPAQKRRELAAPVRKDGIEEAEFREVR